MALLIVADVSPARGGVHVLPRLESVDVADRGPFAVDLVFPDGTSREARAVIDVPHVRGPSAPIGMLRLLDLAPDDVPIGTRVIRRP